jgi:hypothetical protein
LATRFFLLIIFMFMGIICFSQTKIDSLFGKIDPEKWATSVDRKLAKLEEGISNKSEKYLRKLQGQEEKILQKLSKLDSTAAQKFLAAGQQKYRQLTDQLQNKVSEIPERLSGEYLPYFDSLKGTLSFLDKNKGYLSAIQSAKVSDALNQFNQFQNKLQQAEAIKQFIRERRQQMTELLSRYTALPKSVTRALENYKKEAYYYSQQIREYREMFNDPDKLLRKSLVVLNKLPAFQKFMKEHSELGSLFAIPGNYNSSLALIGLQTRDQVQQIITTQLGGGSNAGQVFSQAIQSAQPQLDQFKQKINSLGGGSGDIDMPNFKPNTQRTKTLLQRVEYGTSIQSTKSTRIFPSTTDIALMVGYRIDDKKIIGIGVGGKIGWGKDIRHIDVTGQGINFRSFIDIKIKNSFYASGGFEYNYQKPFKEIQRLYDVNEWSKSGLVGISKIISLKSKVFKKTKLQLLWDILNSMEHRQNVSQPIKFRVQYDF